MERYKQIEKSLITTYRSKIWSKFVAAIKEYELIKDGDKIAVCISGGKDSMLLAKCMQELKRYGKNNFEVEFLVMNPGYNEINLNTIIENAKILNIPIVIFKSDIFEAVSKIEKSPCYICAKMRRGYLYSFAKQLGCNKIALGHHFDDVIETILMGVLYNGQIQTMMPKLHSDNFEGMELIRPLYHIKESDIVNWKNYNELNFIQCACRFTEKTSDEEGENQTSKRQEAKMLIKNLKKSNPCVESNIFKSVYNVNLKNVIAYKEEGKKIHFLDHYDKV